MDTFIVPDKHLPRLIVNALNVSIIISLLFLQHVFESPPILAQERVKIANGALVSPILDSVGLEKNITEQITIEERTQKFNEEIKRKYKAGVIIDVDKGVKHIKLLKYYQGKPVKINVIEMNPALNKSIEITPVLASDILGKRATITSIAQKNNSIVAINGTFFKPSTGIPLGTLMINRKMYTGPVYDRVAMGIFKEGFDMARIQLNASLQAGNKILKIDNINQPRMLSTHVIVYTPQWGNTAPLTPKYGTQVSVSNNQVINVSTSQLPIPEDGFVVVGPALKLGEFAGVQNVKLEVSTTPEWSDVNHIISGGPYLVKNSQVYVDIKEQKLESISGRNPRTAIGYTNDNHLIIVTVDGRENASVGMTLTELANFMKSVDCSNAMNLDGGGSTVLYVNGKVANNPQVKGGINLPNALTLNRI